MTTSTLKIEHVRLAVAELRAIEKRVGELATNLEARLEGSETVGESMKRITEAFVELWERRYRAKYAFAGGKDATSVRRLVKAMPVDEVLRRLPHYFSNDDEFYVRLKHSLSMFASTINQHGVVQRAPDTAGPIDCRHTPPCQSDVEHTRRANAELRQ